MSSSTISQLSCFSSICRTAHLRPRSSPRLYLPHKEVLVVRSSDGRATDASTSENKATISYNADSLRSRDVSPVKSKPSREAYGGENEMSEPVGDHISTQTKSAAKIHDFCFGIPFGGIVLLGGVVGFIFSRNPETLGIGVLFGGALLALSTISLKVWRDGKSSLPFILGQAVLAASLLWKNVQTYSLSKKIIPTGFYAAISAAMLCFYFYVVLSGGNPPPKKLKQSAVISSH